MVFAVLHTIFNVSPTADEVNVPVAPRVVLVLAMRICWPAACVNWTPRAVFSFVTSITSPTADAAGKADQLDIERERIESQEKIAGMQVGAKVAKDKADLEAKMELEGLKIGTDIAHKKAQLNVPKGTQKKGE